MTALSFAPFGLQHSLWGIRMIYASDYGARWNLQSPTAVPGAAGFLWNPHLRLRASCRGLAQSEWLAEAGDDAPAPPAERFVYLRDEDAGELYSAPYEPVRRAPELFNFSVGQDDIAWDTRCGDIDVRMQVMLPAEDAVELWSITLANRSQHTRTLSLFPYFGITAQSPVNQSAEYRPDIEGILAECHASHTLSKQPLQLPLNTLKTFLLHERTPLAWQVRQQAFAGEGGLHNPSALQAAELACDDARQEASVAVLQYRLTLAPGESETYRLMFGRARDKREITHLRQRYLSAAGYSRALAANKNHTDHYKGAVQIDTPDENLNHFVNHWLVREIAYGADTSVRDDEPATRDYLQDHLGLIYIDPARARAGLLHALAQQKASGAMPVSLRSDTTLTMPAIGQHSNSDDCLWLTVFLRAYLDETGDHSLLHTAITDAEGVEQSVFERINRAMHWALQSRGHLGLCDMTDSSFAALSPRGMTVSASQNLMAVHVFKLWAEICQQQLLESLAEKFRSGARDIAAAANRHLWDDDWYVRGLTSEGISFGSRRDVEGQLYLAPQAWALLAGAGSELQHNKMLGAVERLLNTPHGVMNLAPGYSAAQAEIGAITLWHPGTGENASLHTHTAACYAYSLYSTGETERAFNILRPLMPCPESGDDPARQLPTHLPAWRFGAYEQYPARTGQAAPNTATDAAAWLYRTVIEGLLGLKGCREGLRLNPQLPAHWPSAKVVRHFRGATLYITLERENHVTGTHITVDGEPLDDDGILRKLKAGKRYQVEVIIGRQALSLAAEQSLKREEKKRA